MTTHTDKYTYIYFCYTPLAKFRSEGRGQLTKGLVKAGIGFELAAGLLFFLVSLSLSNVLATYVVNRPEVTHFVQTASPLVLGSVLFTTSCSIFIGLDEMEKAALLSVFNSITKAIAAPALIVLGFGIAGAIAGHVLGFLGAGIAGCLIALSIHKDQNHGSNISPSFTSNLALMAKYGMPLQASTLLGGLLAQCRSIILPWFTSNVEVGNYSVAIILSSLVAVLTTPISTALFPAFSRLDSSGSIPDLRQFLLHSLRYTLFLVIPSSVFVAATSNDLVGTLYGSAYDLAPLYLSIYSPILLLSGFSLVLGSFFRGVGRTDISLKAALIQLPVTIVFSVALTRLYGVPGFICAAIASTALSVAYLVRQAHLGYGLRFESKRVATMVLISILSSIPSSAVALLPCPSFARLVLASAAFSLTYLTLSPILGTVEYADLANLRQISSGMRLVSRISDIALTYEERILAAVHSKSKT
jgi:O-antigen/teichoic acid export membrane protein